MNRWIVLIAFVFLLQLEFTAVIEAGTTLPQSDEAGDIDIAQTVRSLRKIKTHGLDTMVPIAAKPLLTTLKRQLRNLISRTLDSYGNRPGNLDAVQTVLLQELQKQGIALEKSEVMVVDNNQIDNDYTYGDIRQIKVEKLAHHPGLVAATTTIGVCCGHDTSFYAFRKSGRHWELVIAQEADNYDEVSGAQGSFRYAVSPPSGTGRFFW